MIINDVDITSRVLLLPFILAQVYVLSLGLSLFLAAAFVRFRDINYIWEVLLQAAFYATPIIYPLSLITNTSFQQIIMLNPMAQAIQDARNVLVTTQTQTIAEVYGSSAMRLVPLTISFLILIVGVWYFRREARMFAENL